MLRKYIRATSYVAITALFLGFIVSCEEDFTDIGTTIVSNQDFSTNDTIFEIEVSGKNTENVRADGLAIGGLLGQYLLGVYNNNNYKKIEASIISQLSIPTDLSQVDEEYGADTTVVTTIDTVLLRLPYNATLIGNDAIGPEFQLDSIIGNQEQPFTLNVYRLTTFLSTLDPTDPSIQNTFSSDQTYNTSSEKLNFFEDTQFVPNKRDTSQFVLRRLNSGAIYDTDTISYTNSNPYISIPLKKDLIKSILFDQYETSNFSSQDAFNDYFRGIKIQAEGDDGSLISLSFNNSTLQPLVDIYYTNTVYRAGGTIVIDTIKKTDTFLLSGVRNSEYKMTPGQIPAFNNVPVQGTAGSIAQLKILGDDTDLNGIPDILEELRTKNWLINDATITLYVDQDVVGFDTIAIPFRLFIFRDGIVNGEEAPRQILDFVTEGLNQVGGFLELDDDKKPNTYTFKITDYISELLSGSVTDLPTLGVKVLNPTDLPVSLIDSIVRDFNWNPKAVTLLNSNAVNGSRKAQLKISYSLKTEQN
jgi:hypothetical protein